MEPERKAGNIVALSLALFAFSASACASTITFNVSGTMTDGAVLGGRMTVDEIAGTVTAFSFTLGAPDSLTTSVLDYDGTITQGANTFWLLETGVAPGPYPALSLVLPTSTLVGYNGGSICSISALCGSGLGSGLLLPPAATQGPFLQSGSASAVPEPATLSLLALAFPVVFLLRRRLCFHGSIG